MSGKARYLVAVLLTLAIVVGLNGGTAQAQSRLTDVTFCLDYIVLGRHAPWYVALDKGYYKSEGLNVKIIPGKGTAQVIQAVESGIVDIGFIDVPGLILGRAGGSTIKIVAVNYQKAPYAIFSLDPGANVTRVKDLEGLEMASSSGSFVPNVIKGFMKMHGLDPSLLKVVNVTPPAKASMLLSRKVESIEFFIMSKPELERGVKGAELRTLLLGDHGLVLYSNSIGAKEAFIKKNPEVMGAFVRGSLRGWNYALANPEEAADRQLKYAKGLDRDITVAELGILRNLAIVPDTLNNGLGWFSPAKMEISLDFVLTNVGVPGPAPKTEDLYATSFLPETPILP